MLTNNDRITSWQMVLVFIMGINATGILTMPRVFYASTGPDGWVALIIQHVALFIGMAITIILGRRFPDQTFVEYNQQIVGKLLGTIITITAGVFWVLISARIVRVFADIIKVFILVETPVEVMILSMLLVSVYITRHGLEPIARMAELLFPLMVIAILLVTFFALWNIDKLNLLPIFGAGVWPSIVAGLKASFFDLQMKVSFLLLLPFLLKPRNALKISALALSIDLAFRVTIFLVTVGVFGGYVLDFFWPVAMLAKFVEIPGEVFARLEMIFLGFWIGVTLSSLLIHMYLASLSFARLFKLRESSMLTLPLLPIIFIISLIPPNVMDVEILDTIEGVLGGILFWIVPTILLVIAWIRKIDQRVGAND